MQIHGLWSEPEFINLLRSPGIDSQPCGPVRKPFLKYRPAKLHRLTKSIPRNRFPGSLNVHKCGLCHLMPRVSESSWFTSTDYSSCRLVKLMWGILYGTPKKRPASEGLVSKGPAMKGPASNGYVILKTCIINTLECTEKLNISDVSPGCLFKGALAWEFRLRVSYAIKPIWMDGRLSDWKKNKFL